MILSSKHLWIQRMIYLDNGNYNKCDKNFVKLIQSKDKTMKVIIHKKEV